MKQTIDIRDFHRAFETMGRGEQFSYDGRKALFEYLEQLEDECGTEIELDVIALCCDFSEERVLDVLKNYDLKSLDELRDNTMVIDVDTSDDDENNHTIIYQSF
jgi:hypothetical protein